MSWKSIENFFGPQSYSYSVRCEILRPADCQQNTAEEAIINCLPMDRNTIYYNFVLAILRDIYVY